MRGYAPTLWGAVPQQELLKSLFGVTAATYASESTLDVRRHEMEANRLHVGSRGKVLGSVAASAVAGVSTAARAATRQGGGTLPE